MDRWEEQAGYFASTMAVEIPALLAAAELADVAGENATAIYFRETADAWNDLIEELIYVCDTDLARSTGVDGYYVRFARPNQMEATKPALARWICETMSPVKAGLQWQKLSVPMPFAWFGLVCAPPTILGS